MTTTAASDHVVDPQSSACSCGSDHDHGLTGADIVKLLGKGFAILTLIIPVAALFIVCCAFVATPHSPLPLLLGVALGLAQLAVLLGLSAVARKVGTAATLSPGFLVLRVIVEEVFRLAIALLALVQFSYEWRGALGLWIGIGTMLVWALLTTVQSAMARTKILKPGDWSKATVLALLDEGISPKRAITLRALDVIGVLLFQVAATILVTAAPIMIVATVVLSIATGFSTLYVQRLAPRRRQHTIWVYIPIIIGALTALLAAVLVIAPGIGQ